MQGNFAVSFHFEETVPLQAGYQPTPAKDSSAREKVVVVVDEPTHIELQHLLVITGGRVIKHWRQEWDYEATSSWAFTGHQRYQRTEAAPADVKGTWTQRVYEVSDAPRYAAKGRWVHLAGVSTWTSEQGLRPLPRREYTKRSDYDVIEAVNRHTITPTGWTHEQDNTKQLRRCGQPQAPLAREHGLNEYTLIDDSLEPATAYWQATGLYWAEVRARWKKQLAAHDLELQYPVNEEKKLIAFLEQAQTFEHGADLAAAQKWLDGVFTTQVAATSGPACPAQQELGSLHEVTR